MPHLLGGNLLLGRGEPMMKWLNWINMYKRVLAPLFAVVVLSQCRCFPWDGTCGDGTCQDRFEDVNSCPADCTCGDGTCSQGYPQYENSQNCPQDCTPPPTPTPQALQDWIPPVLGDCGDPCESSDDCQEGLACFDAVCWEDCRCEGNCGGGGGERPSCHECSSDAECRQYCAGNCSNGCCNCP
jgi:hypothetical protein